MGRPRSAPPAVPATGGPTPVMVPPPPNNTPAPPPPPPPPQAVAAPPPPPPPAPVPVPVAGPLYDAHWPGTSQHWRDFRNTYAYSANKNYGGTRGDSAFVNWALAVLEIGAAGAVTAFSWRFLSAYGAEADKISQDYSTAYYVCEFIFPFSILTEATFTIYVIWIFLDARHPMRKAWLAMREKRGPDNFKDQYNREITRPGAFTLSFPMVNRLTINRLYAERAHIRKMIWIYVVFFIAWLIPFMIMTLHNGYITWTKVPSSHDVKVAKICGTKQSNKICWELAKAGISAGCVTVLFLGNLLTSMVAITARPLGSTTRGP